MEFKKLKSPDSADFREAWKICESSLPSDERRSLSRQLKIFDNRKYEFSAVYEKRNIIGVLATWKFDNFILIEHLAIRKGLRGHGLGTQLMKEYISKRHARFLLETERPRTRIARRRIKFYERLGFILSRHDYIQPPYGKGKKAIPMILMSYPNPISKKEFSEIRNEIHRIVYGLGKPLLKI
jgi:ribosomal protein S18 acetylase RimI-like enzyme